MPSGPLPSGGDYQDTLDELDIKMTSLDERKAETERMMGLLADTPAILRGTQKHRGNRLDDLHPMHSVLPRATPVNGLKNMVCVIGGASRGIGHGMAVRFAMSAPRSPCWAGRTAPSRRGRAR